MRLFSANASGTKMRKRNAAALRCARKVLFVNEVLESELRGAPRPIGCAALVLHRAEHSAARGPGPRRIWREQHPHRGEPICLEDLYHFKIRAERRGRVPGTRGHRIEPGYSKLAKVAGLAGDSSESRDVLVTSLRQTREAVRRIAQANRSTNSSPRELAPTKGARNQEAHADHQQRPATASAT